MWKVTLRQLLANFRKNIWLLLELFFVTIIVWYAVDFLMVICYKKFEPTGVDMQHVYQLTVRIHPERWQSVSNEDSLDIVFAQPKADLAKMIASHPSVIESAYYTGTDLVGTGMTFQRYMAEGEEETVDANIRYVSPEYFDVLKVDIMRGEVTPWECEFPQSAVISSDLAIQLFGTTDAIGRNFSDYFEPSAKYKVVAVCAPMKFDYFREYEPFIYTPIPQIRMRYELGRFLFRVKDSDDHEGFAEEFFAEMRDKLAIGPFYLLEVVPIKTVENEYLNALNIPRYVSIAIGVVLFFLFIVFLGVLGTYWFQIERRRNEVGIRMAMGSSRRMLLGYMIRESTILLLLSYIPAFVITVLLAYFGVTYTFRDCMPYTWGRFFAAQGLTFIILYIIVLLGTWIPAYRASILNPVDALSEE